MFAFHIPRHMTKWRGMLQCIHPVRGGQHLNPSCLNLRPQSLRSIRAYTAQTFKDFATKDPILLRDTCQCAQCIDPHSHQREFSYVDIPTNIAVSSIEPHLETGTWKVTWDNDVPGFAGHVSTFTPATLLQLLDGTPERLGVQRTISLWDRKTYEAETKRVDFDALMKNEQSLGQALELIQKHGLVFVVDIPHDEDAVTKLVTRLTGLYRNTFYGTSWDVQSIPEAKNVAYTSKDLGFHMDLLYMKEPPGLQLLHCLHNTCVGGESEYADTFKIVDTLQQENPQHVETLVNSSIRYGYRAGGDFYSDEKPFIKVGNGKHLPIPRILHAADPAFMASVDRVYWSPQFINSIASAPYKGDTKAFIEASKAFVEIMGRQELIFETKLPAGTCAVFDNLRVVHARKEFDANSGRRWLKGIYGDRQDVLNMSLKHVWKQ